LATFLTLTYAGSYGGLAVGVPDSIHKEFALARFLAQLRKMLTLSLYAGANSISIGITLETGKES